MKEDPAEANERRDLIIKNTYRTLMTRGMKGCYVYFRMIRCRGTTFP